ncbi:MAG: hypothetical protein AB1467_01690 [Candidatus Diapherotrites archaeon]
MSIIKKYRDYKKKARELKHVRPYEIELEGKKNHESLGKFIASFIDSDGKVFLFYLDERELSIVRRHTLEPVGFFSFRENIIKVGNIEKNYRGLGLSHEAIKLLEPKMRAEC